MRFKWLLISALAWACPAAAQEAAETPDFGGMSDAQLREQLASVGTEGFSDACRSKVPLFAEVARRHPNAAARSGSLTAEAFCAYEEDRDADGLRLLKKSETLAPATFHGLGLYFAVQLEDGAEAVVRLRGLSRQGLLNSFDKQLIFFGLRVARADDLGGELDQLAYEITASDEFGQLDPDLQGSFASAAIRHGVRSGDLSRVDDLLQFDSDPSSYLTMLSDRAYEAAWPQIEERVGDNLGNVSDAYVRLTAERLAEAPDDRDRLSRYAYALHYAGRFQEAVDVARNWRPERGNLDGLQEGAAWALNIEAYALDALGRREEADAVFDQLATLSADEFYWVVNFVINRASRLVGQGRWEEGLAATELARTVAAKHGSTFAKMLVARDRACALDRLGQGEDARPEAEFLLEHFNDSASVAATGLMCVGMNSEAERLIATALAEEVPRAGLIDDLQDQRFELFYTPSSRPQPRDLVLANDALREEAFKYVRLLPERFVPVSYLRRTQIAQRGQ